MAVVALTALWVICEPTWKLIKVKVVDDGVNVLGLKKCRHDFGDVKGENDSSSPVNWIAKIQTSYEFYFCFCFYSFYVFVMWEDNYGFTNKIMVICFYEIYLLNDGPFSFSLLIVSGVDSVIYMSVNMWSLYMFLVLHHFICVRQFWLILFFSPFTIDELSIKELSIVIKFVNIFNGIGGSR